MLVVGMGEESRLVHIKKKKKKHSVPQEEGMELQK